MSATRTLHLNLHRRFFDDIASGEKVTEYRDRTAYWAARLEGRTYDVVVFRNGYVTDAREMRVEVKGIRKVVRKGNPQYAIQLGRILPVKR